MLHIRSIKAFYYSNIHLKLEIHNSSIFEIRILVVQILV